jgi:hypothetical protein
MASMAPNVSSGHSPNARLDEFQISPAAVDSRLGRFWPPHSSGACRPPQPPARTAGRLLPAGRRDYLAVDQLGAGAVADHAQGIEHLGAELAGFLDHRADGVLVHAENAALDEAVEARGRLQRCMMSSTGA